MKSIEDIETEREESVSTIQSVEPEVVYEEEKPTEYRKYQSNYNQAEIDKRRVRKPGRKLDVVFIIAMVVVAAIYLLKDYDVFHEFSKMLKSEEKQKMQFEAPETTDEMLTDSLYQDSLAMIETDTALMAENAEAPKTQQATQNTQPAVAKPQSVAQNTQPAVAKPQSVAQKPQSVVPKPQPVAQKPKSQVDSLRILFDKPRVYKEFIGSEEVRVGSRLTRISERHYGVKDFWVYIYEANKEKFTSPDEVEPGTILRIPKLDPRIANPKNPGCMEYARELHDKYVKKK
jgi:nucleoid-associated protein YgaU